VLAHLMRLKVFASLSRILKTSHPLSLQGSKKWEGIQADGTGTPEYWLAWS